MKAKDKKGSKVMRGGAVCGGLAIGKPFFLAQLSAKAERRKLQDHELESEVDRFHEALRKTKEEIETLIESLHREKLSVGVQILETHLEILKDPLLCEVIPTSIKEKKTSADYLLLKEIQRIRKRLERVKEPFFKERIKEYFDVSKRVLRYLSPQKSFSIKDCPVDSIIFSDSLIVQDVATAGKNCRAFVTKSGGSLSHAAILARARGIPFVCNVSFNEKEVMKSTSIVVDGRKGVVVFDPSKDEVENTKRLSSSLGRYFKELEKEKFFPAVTLDGVEITLRANIDSLEDVACVDLTKQTGIGLFRSESMIFQIGKIPTEEEQFHFFSSLFKKCKNGYCCVRAFDLGGDKSAFAVEEKKPSTSIDLRGVGYLLSEISFFKEHLRALLRAAYKRSIHFLLPMVSSVAEIRQVKALIGEVSADLKKRGIPHGTLLLGAMLENPSAALMASAIGRESKFLSLGTNDLTQYTLAKDRNSHLFHSREIYSDPGLLKLIEAASTGAMDARVSLSICGEMASDPRFVLLLMPFGIKEFSLSPRFIPQVKYAVRKVRISDLLAMKKQVETFHAAEDVFAYLESTYKQLIPEDIYFGSV